MDRVMVTEASSSSRQRTLIELVTALSAAPDAESIRSGVAGAARRLAGADGATLVLREGDECHYVDEDAITPLWKGQRFAASACVSGWAMMHRQAVVIPDIARDVRVPQNAYRPTFVRSMAMFPVRREDPIAAIGLYWAVEHAPDAEEVELLQALADCTALALQNVGIRAELERRVEERTAEARATAALNETLLRTLAHEVGNPLSVTEGLLELMLDDHSLPAATRDDLRAARAAVRSGLAVVAQQLALAKLRSGRVPVALQDVDVVALVRELVAAERAAPYRTPGVELKVDVDGPMPRLRSDPALLTRVLRNLLANAVAFTDAGEVRVRICALADDVLVEVIDTGIGIAEADLERVFGEWEQVEGARAGREPGCGLGLPLARGLTELVGGMLTLSSRVGAGTRAEVRLPLYRG